MWSKTSTMDENLIFHHFINFFIHIWYFIYISPRCATSWLTLPKESQPASRLRISMRYTPTSLKGKSFWGEVHYYLCKGEFLFRIIKQLKHGFCQAVLALLFTTRQSDADPEQKEAVLSYMEKAASRQGGTVNPANIRWNIVMLVVAHFRDPADAPKKSSPPHWDERKMWERLRTVWKMLIKIETIVRRGQCSPSSIARF